MSSSAPVRVALACQGGGAQTAFTAGALTALQERRAALGGEAAPFSIVGLSGTSGGALCAAMCWRDLLLGLPADGRPTVERFWMTPYPEGNAVAPPAEALKADLGGLATAGHVPWQASAAALRNRAGLGMMGLLDAVWRPLPFRAEVGMQPGFWQDRFDTIDASPVGWLASTWVELMRGPLAGRALRTIR